MDIREMKRDKKALFNIYQEVGESTLKNMTRKKRDVQQNSLYYQCIKIDDLFYEKEASEFISRIILWKAELQKSADLNRIGGFPIQKIS